MTKLPNVSCVKVSSHRRATTGDSPHSIAQISGYCTIFSVTVSVLLWCCGAGRFSFEPSLMETESKVLNVEADKYTTKSTDKNDIVHTGFTETKSNKHTLPPDLLWKNNIVFLVLI